MNMNEVVVNFSPFYTYEDKEVCNLHIEDRTDPLVYARFELRLPSLEVIESGRMNPASQNEIIDFIKEHISAINSLKEQYQGYSLILGDICKD